MSRNIEIAGHVLDRVADRAEAEVVVSSGVSALTRFANSFIHQNVAEEGYSVGLRVAVEGRVNSATTTSLDRLDAFVDNTIAVASMQRIDEGWPGLTPPLDILDSHHFDEATATASAADRATLVGEFVAAAPECSAAGYCETVGHEVAFVNTDGHRAFGRYTRATIDGIHQTDRTAGSGHATSVRLDDLDGAAVGAMAAERARQAVVDIDVDPGEYQVVLGPEAVATIAMFLAYYGFNGKQHAEGQSFVRLGDKQFDAAIELTEDATDPRALGVGFDAEGTPRHRLELISGGVTKAIAHDRRTASKAGVSSTGHGDPGSERWGPLPTHVFLQPGATAAAEMIRSVDRGLYIATFNYCRVLDPKTLAVTGLTRNGTFMIDNGEIVGAVSNLRFTQSFVEALGQGRVQGIGDDARFADSEFGPGMMHVPSLHLERWKITGGAAG